MKLTAGEIYFIGEKDLKSGIDTSYFKIGIVREGAKGPRSSDEHLYEAKGSAAREKVRMAAGQLLDYKRLMEEPPRKLSVLLPHEPSPDIKSFLTAYGIGSSWQQEDGSFKSL